MQIKLVAKIQTLSTFNTKLKQLMISSMAQPCRIREMIQKGVELNQDQVKGREEIQKQLFLICSLDNTIISK